MFLFHESNLSPEDNSLPINYYVMADFYAQLFLISCD